MAILVKIKWMALAFLLIRMDTFIKGIFRRTKSMDMVLSI